MKKIFFLITLLSLIFTSSCTNKEGEGGRSTVEGYVYQINVNDDLSRDTFPARKEKVQIIYGDKLGLDDMDTDKDGFYHFDYLREGNYTVTAYTKLESDENRPISKTVRVSGDDKTYRLDTIYVEAGKALNTFTVSGTCSVEYWLDKRDRSLAPVDALDAYISVYRVDSVAAYQYRVLLTQKEDPSFLEDTRVNEQGTYSFFRLKPGHYTVSVEKETWQDIDSFVTLLFEINKEGQIIVNNQIVQDLGVLLTRKTY